MARRSEAVSTLERKRAQEYNERGLRHYERWEIEDAIESFRAAVWADPDHPDYHLNLARAFIRAGDYEQAMRSLADFIRLEKRDVRLVDRFERLFARGMDAVETVLTRKMREGGRPLEEIGAAMQMWMEYRIALGRQPLSMRRPEAWAAALDYTVAKIHLRDVSIREVAWAYQVSESTLRSRFRSLVEVLDIMPCDYRYFRGRQNPLDKLVEAALLLEELEERFNLEG